MWMLGMPRLPNTIKGRVSISDVIAVYTKIRVYEI